MTGKDIFSVLTALQHLNDLPCPYFPCNFSSGMELFNCNSNFLAATYEQLLSLRFRRIGTMIYRPLCHGCFLCIPVRLNVNKYSMGKSHKQVMNRNRDTHCELRSLRYQPEYLELFNNYLITKHGGEPHNEDNFISEYHQSPFKGASKILACLRPTDQGNKLAAISYIDILPDGISSIYCVYDVTNFGKLSLGIFTMLKEIELCKTMNKQWYYPGFWIAGCPTMEYKANFEPLEFCFWETWRPLTSERKEEFRMISKVLSNLHNN